MDIPTNYKGIISDQLKEELQRADDIIGHNVSGTESRQTKEEKEEVKCPSVWDKPEKDFDGVKLAKEIMKKGFNKTPTPNDWIEEIMKEFCNGLASELKPCNESMEAVIKLKEKLPNFILQVRTDTINEIRKEVERIQPTQKDIDKNVDKLESYWYLMGKYNNSEDIKTFLNKLDK